MGTTNPFLIGFMLGGFAMAACWGLIVWSTGGFKKGKTLQEAMSAKAKAARYDFAVAYYRKLQGEVDARFGEGAAGAIITLMAAWQRVGETHGQQEDR